MQEDAPFVVVLTCDWNILMIMCKLPRTFNVNVFQKKFKAFRANTFLKNKCQTKVKLSVAGASDSKWNNQFW